MKKIFTLAAAVLASVAMMASITLVDFTFPDETATTSSGSMGTAADDWQATWQSIGGSNDNVKTLNGVNYYKFTSGTNSHLTFTLKDETFQEGDSLFFTIYCAGAKTDGFIIGDQEITVATSKTEEVIGKGELSASNAGSSISLKRKSSNCYIRRVWITRAGEPKTIVSTEESLTAVTINDVAISATALASLVSNTYLFLSDAYVTAPVVKFTKHTVITYDDQSTKVKDEVIEVTSQPATTTWGASATINGNSYYVYTQKAASRTVTYMYGEQVLGTEIVAVNGNPAEYAQYETMPLATFGGWYKDADLTQAVANIAAEVISVNATYYAKFTKAFLSESVNIEQLVLDYGTSYDIRSALTAAGWAYKDLNDLDTLNDIENKTARNEPFLGLKLKTTGAYVQGWLPSDGLLIVKFGNVGCDIKVTVKGANTDLEATYTKDQLAEQNYEFPVYGFTEEVLVTFTTTGSSTVVLKQLMMDEIAEVTLPAPGAYLVSCEEAEHGEIKASWPNKKYRTPIGETVTLTVTPNSGYKVVDVQVDGVSLNAVEGVYSFVMPAKDVTVTASFEQDEASAINNTNANVKAVKVVRNGQLFIEKNGVVYNAQGTIVR